MKREVPKVGTFWSRNKNIIRGTLLGLAAVSTGIAIYQNVKAEDKIENIKSALTEAEVAIENSDETEYNKLKGTYNSDKKELRSAENMRNGFYITAGVFSVAGVVCFFF